MGRPWHDHPSWDVVQDASDVAGRDIETLLLDAGTEELAETRNAQLATFVMGLVVLDAVERLGIEPTACAGHSLGEYTALVAAGAIGFEDAVRLVAERGEAMQEAAEENPGIMLALAGIDDELARIACRRADGDVWLANSNAPGECVIAGRPAEAHRAADVARELGATLVTEVAVERRVPHAADGTGSAPPAKGAEDARRFSLWPYPWWPTWTPSPIRRWRSGRRCCRPSCAAPSAGARASSPWRRSCEPASGTATTCSASSAPEAQLSAMVKATVPEAVNIPISVPDDLDTLVATLTGGTVRPGVREPPGRAAVRFRAAGHKSLRRYIPACRKAVPGPTLCRRLRAVPPTPRPAPCCRPPSGTPIEIGDLVGLVSGTEVRSPFAGRPDGRARPPRRTRPSRANPSPGCGPADAGGARLLDNGLGQRPAADGGHQPGHHDVVRHQRRVDRRAHRDQAAAGCRWPVRQPEASRHRRPAGWGPRRNWRSKPDRARWRWPA